MKGEDFWQWVVRVGVAMVFSFLGFGFGQMVAAVRFSLFRSGWRRMARKRESAGELALVAGFEAGKGGEDEALALGGVAEGEPVEFGVGLAVGVALAVGVGFAHGGAEGCVFVLVDRGLGGEDAEATPFVDDELVNQLIFEEVAGIQFGAGPVGEGAEFEVEFSGYGAGFVVGLEAWRFFFGRVGFGLLVFGRHGLESFLGLEFGRRGMQDVAGRGGFWGSVVLE